MSERHWPYPLWVAHRGAGKLAPENTLVAFRLGSAHGFRMFECDVKLSADGVPFLLHDDTLDRTTGAKGIAGDRPWAMLSRLDAGSWHSRQYAGEPVPTLEAVARFVQHNAYALNVEIKPTNGAERHTGESVAAACAELWRDRPLLPLLSSFRPEALAGAQTTAPLLPRALLLDTLWSGWQSVARSLDCVAVVTQHKLMDAAVRDELRSQGWRALCYTVNQPADAERLLALGVDGLITDEVDRFAPARLKL